MSITKNISYEAAVRNKWGNGCKKHYIVLYNYMMVVDVDDLRSYQPGLSSVTWKQVGWLHLAT